MLIGADVVDFWVGPDALDFEKVLDFLLHLGIDAQLDVAAGLGGGGVDGRLSADDGDDHAARAAQRFFTCLFNAGATDEITLPIFAKALGVVGVGLANLV